MTPTDRPLAPPLHPAAQDLERWRDRLLDRLLRVALVAGAVPAALSVVRALQGGDWLRPLIGLLAFAAVALVAWRADLSYRVRAWTVLGIIYGMGLWLLLQVGTATQIYLLASPLLAVLLLPLRTALGLLTLSGLTLVGVGWGLDLPLEVPGMADQPALKWLNHGSNFMFLGAMLTLSCSFLLRRLERAVDEQRAVSESLRNNEEHLREMAAQVPGMVYRLRADRHGNPDYLYVSPGAQPLFGVTPDALIDGSARILALTHPEDRIRLRSELARACEEGRGFSLEFRVVLAGGQQKWIHANATAVSHDEASVLHSGIMIDITERKASEALVWEQAHFDALTGLANRTLLRERLDTAMAQALRDQHPLALLLIDLDHFKEVNDTLGHESGDLLLVEAAHRIQRAAGEGTVVARMGGDEFCVVLPAITAPVQADRVAQRLIATLAEPFHLGLERAYVSASLGIALYPADADGLDNLLKHADQALYAAKDAGRNRFRYFTRTLQDEAQLRMRLATDLRSALASGQFHLVYQPIIDLATGAVRKAEALLRWTHPDRGAISPVVFIPIAESSGLISEIGDWVFRSAADQVQRWRSSLDPQFQISVNRSPAQFRSDASGGPGWGEQLAQRGLPGDSIVVEITEGLLLDTGPGVTDQLHALKQAGLPISLDDFGTGYSAMAYLQKFDIDYLKIDRRFVSGMQQDATGRALCKAIIVMAHELGMKVVAEGVETAEQRDWLKAAGCDHGQGFLFARPMVPEQFERWLAEHRSHGTGGVPAAPAAPPIASAQAEGTAARADAPNPA